MLFKTGKYSVTKKPEAGSIRSCLIFSLLSTFILTFIFPILYSYFQTYFEKKFAGLGLFETFLNYGFGLLFGILIGLMIMFLYIKLLNNKFSLCPWIASLIEGIVAFIVLQEANYYFVVHLGFWLIVDFTWNFVYFGVSLSIVIALLIMKSKTH